MGTCGPKCRVRMPQGYVYDDGADSSYLTYIDRAKLSIPVSEVRVEPSGPQRLFEGDDISFKAETAPSIADDADVSWSSTDPSVVEVGSSGEAKALKAGKAEVTASAGGVAASVPVTVDPLVELTEPHVANRSRTWVRLAWSACTRAESYRVQVKWKGRWREAASTAKASLKVRSFKAGKRKVGLEPGRKYAFRVVPYGAGGVIGRASDKGNACRACTKRKRVAVEIGAGKKTAASSKGRVSAEQKTRQGIVDKGTYSFANWTERVELADKQLGKLHRVLSKGNAAGADGGQLKGRRLKTFIKEHKGPFCYGMAVSCYLDLFGDIDIVRYVGSKKARCVGDLKKGKRVKRLIKYYHLLQTGFTALDNTVYCPLKDRNLNFRSYKKNKKLRRFVARAKGGELQVMAFRYGILGDVVRHGHAMVVLPFVRDRMTKRGYCELYACDPDNPNLVSSFRVKSNGEVVIPGFVIRKNTNLVTEIQYFSGGSIWNYSDIVGR